MEEGWWGNAEYGDGGGGGSVKEGDRGGGSMGEVGVREGGGGGWHRGVGSRGIDLICKCKPVFTILV